MGTKSTLRLVSGSVKTPDNPPADSTTHLDRIIGEALYHRWLRGASTRALASDRAYRDYGRERIERLIWQRAACELRRAA